MFGANTPLSYAQTINAEGGLPDHVYWVVPDSINSDMAGENIGQFERSKGYWSALAVNPSTMTNCSVAATNVLSAANSWFSAAMTLQIPTPWGINASLQNLNTLRSQGANTGVYLIR